MLQSMTGKAEFARIVAVLIMILTAFVVAGCSEQSDASKKDQAGNQKPKMVVVNQGMTKEEEKDLTQRLADLEDKVNDQSTQQPAQEATQDTRSSEDSVRTAVQAYYAAAATGNYGYTYNELSSFSQSQFTEEEWVSANIALGSDTASYGINSVDLVDDSTAEVNLTISAPDGTSSERTTWFVLEDGAWKHELTQAEYDLFASAGDASASASASAEASASPPASADMDCSDFSSQGVAQAALIADPSDPNGLDEDRDGRACESLAANVQYDAPETTPDTNSNHDPEREGAHRRRPNQQQTNPPPDSAPSDDRKDIDCNEVNGPIRTPPGDPDNLDGDNDGWACE